MNPSDIETSVCLEELINAEIPSWLLSQNVLGQFTSNVYNEHAPDN